MKPLFLLVSFVALFGCSDADKKNTEQQHKINAPTTNIDRAVEPTLCKTEITGAYGWKLGDVLPGEAHQLIYLTNAWPFDCVVIDTTSNQVIYSMFFEANHPGEDSKARDILLTGLIDKYGENYRVLNGSQIFWKTWDDGKHQLKMSEMIDLGTFDLLYSDTALQKKIDELRENEKRNHAHALSEKL